MKWSVYGRSESLANRDYRYLVLGCITCLILGAGYALYLSTYLEPPPKMPSTGVEMFDPNGYNVFQVDWQIFSDPHAQRLTYKMLMAMIGAATLIAFFWHPVPLLKQVRRPILCVAWPICVISCAYVILRVIVSVGGNLEADILITAAVVLALKFWRRRTPIQRPEGFLRLWRRLRKRPIVICTLALIALAMLPTFFIQPNLSHWKWSDIRIVEAHFGGVMSEGDRMAQGFHLLRDVVPHYGIIVSLLVCAWIKQVGNISMSGYIQIIRAMQLLYIVVAAWCYYRVCGRSKAPLFLAAILVAGHYTFATLYWQWYPNHSAWRFLGFPLGMAALILAMRRPMRLAAPFLGSVAGLAILLNLETGVAVTIALAAFVFLQFFSRGTRRSFRLFLQLPTTFTAGMVVVFALFLLLHFIVQGYWLDLTLLPEVYHHISMVSATGYGTSQGVAFRPMAILIFAHATIALLQAARARSQQTGPRNSLRGAIAVMLLVWFVYFANRPTEEYLYCYYIPYGVLLVDTLRTFGALGKYRFSAIALSSMAATAFVLIPVLNVEIKPQPMKEDQGWPQWNLATPNAIMSGVVFADDARSRSIRQKADFIRSLDPSSPIIYLTPDSYLIAKLSGRWSQIPLFDSYADAVTPPDYVNLIESIIESPAPTIYIDPDTTASHSLIPGESGYFVVLENTLSRNFIKKMTVSGWEVWQRRS